MILKYVCYKYMLSNITPSYNLYYENKFIYRTFKIYI